MNDNNDASLWNSRELYSLQSIYSHIILFEGSQEMGAEAYMPILEWKEERMRLRDLQRLVQNHVASK